MIKAAFFDVDGTLLSHKTKTVSQSARDAIAKLQAAGIQCVLATGRQMIALKQLGLADIPFDGFVTLNGQLIFNRDRQILHGIPLKGETKEHLVKLFVEKKLPLMLVEEDRLYVNFIDERVEKVHDLICSPIPPVAEYSGRNLYQVCVYMAEGDEVLLEPIADKCVLSAWSFGGVDVIAKDGGKMVGIQHYLDRYGIKPEEIIAFGDADNDVDMLQFAGIGVCMGNGWDAPKAVADYITADVDEDGIALALKHFGLI